MKKSYISVQFDFQGSTKETNKVNFGLIKPNRIRSNLDLNEFERISNKRNYNLSEIKQILY